eukprot:scaffold61238_cov64-Phaeocystis_antarctica.AAC.1
MAPVATKSPSPQMARTEQLCGSWANKENGPPNAMEAASRAAWPSAARAPASSARISRPDSTRSNPHAKSTASPPCGEKTAAFSLAFVFLMVRNLSDVSDTRLASSMLSTRQHSAATAGGFFCHTVSHAARSMVGAFSPAIAVSQRSRA